jgi:hypothetical protein
MKRAAAIVTNRGGRTCHAAIIARELGVPAVVGGVAGGAGGVLAGSMVNESSLVPGVLISYSEAGKIYTSAQVGKVCEFTPGEISLMVKTLSNETRIQPNAACPEPVKG